MAASSDQQAANSSPEPGLPTRSSDTDVIRVLFVEDDDLYREAIAGELSEHGFAVQSFADGAALLGSLDAAAASADVIILDWSLPKTSGIDLLPRLRRRGVHVPVVFLTGRRQTSYESLAFDRGAVDFIDKTRGVDVLIRRLRLAVKATTPATDPLPDERMVHGKLVLRPSVSRAYWNDVDVGLTVSEYNIVHLLASNVGRYVTYRAIYDRMHYEGFIGGYGPNGYRMNVRSSIKRIRNKFRECDPAFAEIENYAASDTAGESPTRAERAYPRGGPFFVNGILLVSRLIECAGHRSSSKGSAVPAIEQRGLRISV
jgi:two-component system response regulator ChvI